MIRKHINRLNALKTTIAYCENTTADTAGIAAFAPAVAHVKGKVALIESFNILGSQPIKGVTLDVRQIRQSMIENTYPLGSAVYSYAASLIPPNHDLMAQAKLTTSYLEELSKEKCASECDRIRKLASANAANIASFGIAPTDISDTQTIISLYQHNINNPRGSKISRTSANAQAVATLLETENIIRHRLDPMANILRFKKNIWWKGYYQSGEVIDLGTTHTKLRIEVSDAEGKPVKTAIVSLSKAGEILYTKKTNSEGKLSMIKIKPDNYDLRVEKKGLATYNEADIHFASGSEKIHRITLT